jgi:20S proteasome alpha/beta subunit
MWQRWWSLWWTCFNVVAKATSQWGGRTKSSLFPPTHVVSWARHNRQRRSSTTSSSGGNGSSNSNRRRSRDTYDRSVTTFDPTGRLLQVEYAREAAAKSGTKAVSVAALLYNDTIYVAIATKHRRQRQRRSFNAVWQEQQHHQQQQQVLRQYMQRVHAQLFMIPTGLAGDARWVSSWLRSKAQLVLTQLYGEAWTVTQAATALSSMHHELSHTPGARPLGTSCFLLGFDIGSTTTTTLRLIQCAPGSVPRDCWYGTAGPYEYDILQGLHSFYRELCKTTTWKDTSSSNNDHADMDGRIVHGLIETVAQGMGGHSAELRSSHNVTKSEIENQSDDEERISMNVYIIRNGSSGGTELGRLSTMCLTRLSPSHAPSSMDELRRCLSNVRSTRAVDNL